MGFFSSNKVQDILAEKQEKLRQLTDDADSAVDLVTRTISGLEQINMEIDDAMDDIDRYTRQLNETREQLSKNHQHNTAIIANFSKLLETE